MTITAIQPFYRAGVLIAAGPTQLSYSASDEADLVRRGVAAYVGSNPQTGGLVPAMVQTNAITGATELLGTDGVILYGQMVSGAWMKVPTVFRLRLTGTGTVTVNSVDSLGVQTAAVASYTVSGVTGQIEFPYPGDDSAAIQAVFDPTLTVEVL